MKTDIILCGVGGQGILSIAAVIGLAAVNKGLFVKQAEVHGMSQRGGAVQSHLRLSDQEIFSDLISLADSDLILSVEPMESLRYIPYLSEDGCLVTNTSRFENIPDYPDYQKLLSRVQQLPSSILIDGDAIAKDCGSVKASNMVMLGAASSFLPFSRVELIESLESLFSSKGEAVVSMNVNAFGKGEEAATKYKKSAVDS